MRNSSNAGLNIIVGRGSILLHESSLLLQACCIFVFVPGALVAFLTGVGGAFIWAKGSKGMSRHRL